MNNFRDLKFIGSRNEQDKIIQLIEQNLQDGWIRDKDKESECLERSGSEYRIFSRSKVESLPTSDLFLTTDNNSYLYVCNIVSVSQSEELGVETYNEILKEFFNKFVKPHIENLDVRVIFTEASINANNSMSSELAKKFSEFSSIVDKENIVIHDLDRLRFMDFIIQAHLEDALLNEYTLKELLIDENWSEENAIDLSVKYDFGKSLLRKFATLEKGQEDSL